MKRFLLCFIAIVSAACDTESLENTGPDSDPAGGHGAPHIRTLGRRSLLGDTPINNRIVDPLLTFTSSGMYGFASDGSAYAEAYRRVDGRAPTRTPYLELKPQPGPGTTMFFAAKTATTPEVVSVELGRVGGNFDDVVVGLFGVYAGDTEEAGESLAPVPSSKRVIDGITWTRFEAQLPQGPIGFGQLAIIAQDSDSLFIAAPTVVDNVAALPAPRLLPRRPATANEKLLLAAGKPNRLGVAPRRL